MIGVAGLSREGDSYTLVLDFFVELKDIKGLRSVAALILCSFFEGIEKKNLLASLKFLRSFKKMNRKVFFGKSVYFRFGICRPSSCV